MQLIGTIEGRESGYIGSMEAIDTAKAIMHMAQGKATEVDNALLSRSRGAVTLLTAVEGNSKALKSITEAAAYDNSNENYINEEIAADYIGELFGNEQELADFIRESRRDAVTIRNMWYGILDRMGLLDEKKKAQLMWRKAYKEAVLNVKDGKVGKYEGEKFMLVGETGDGRKIYRTNYPEGTPKATKQNDLINLIQNLWYKNPITLKIIENGKTKEIQAKFNPELSERSDLSKIAFGNRKGNGSEKRMTLDLSSDLYQIAADAQQTGSKNESGKDNPAHDGVKHWYYFVTNLVYEANNGEHIDCYMNIDVKEKDSGHYFYSFAIEKGTAPQTLLAAVSDEMSPTVPTNNNVSQDTPVVNTNSMQKGENYSRKSISGTRLSDIEAENAEQSIDATTDETNSHKFIKPGAEPRRDVKVSESVKEGTKVRQFARTAAEAETLTDETAEGVLENVEKGKFNYTPISDKSAMKNAYASLDAMGVEWVEKRVSDAIGSHSLDKNYEAVCIDKIAERIFIFLKKTLDFSTVKR